MVERPASVVKELVENALDADARRVRVELRGGGIDAIAVTDDGFGMTPEDARLALERHATSKIRSLDDLTAIASYGFRGEALPSIAAVARVRLRTRARGATEGFELLVEAGEVRTARVAGHPEGTRVEVADLFASVPARRKFLKSPATEWRHIADGLARVALVRPDVHFDVRRDDRVAMTWPAVSDPIERVAAVLSDREAEALVPIDTARGPIHIHGFVSRPDAHRATAAGLYLFVNGRPVRDRLLRHALLEVYRDVLPRGRFPTALLYLELPSDTLDVNVHPAKWEVRFADPGAVHSALRAAVRGALGERRWMTEARPAPTADASPESLRSPRLDAAIPPRPEAAAPGWLREGKAPGLEPGRRDWDFAGRGVEEGGPAAGVSSAPFRFAELTPLGQLRATYLLLEGADGLVLVDQHAAHERVLFERFRAQWRVGGVARQALLLPVTVELPPGVGGDAATDDFATWAAPLGFELESFGESAVAVRAVPALLGARNPEALVRELADEWSEAGAHHAPARTLEAADVVFASMACHSARRAGDRIEVAEQRELLVALDSIPWSPTCPHGRPVAVPMPLREIERRFGRSD